MEFCFIMSSPSGAQLMQNLLECAPLICLSDQSLIRCYVDTVTKICRLVTMSQNLNFPKSIIAALSFRFPEAVSMSNRSVLCGLSSSVLSLCTRLCDLKPGDWSSKKLPSELFQAVAQAAVACHAAEILPSVPFYCSSLLAMSMDTFLVPMTGRGGVEIELVHGDRGARRLTANTPRESVALGPLLPLAREVTGVLPGTRFIHVEIKIVTMPRTGITIGIAPRRVEEAEDWKAVPGSVGWSSEGILTVTTVEDSINSRYGPKYLVGDVIGMEAYLTKTAMEVSYYRNGVFIGLAVGSVDSEATIELAELSSTEDETYAVMVCLTDGGDEVCFLPHSEDISGDGLENGHSSLFQS